MNMTPHNKKYHVTLNDVVQVVFIVLKLCKLTDWSWWAVLIPSWVSLGFIALKGLIIAAKHEANNRTKEEQE